MRLVASSTVLVIGFSTSTCFPDLIAFDAMYAWVTVGVQIEIAFTSGLSNIFSGSVYQSTRYLSPSSLAVFSFTSAMAMREASSRSL